MAYGAQLVVEASTSDEAVDAAIGVFANAAASAGLPPRPITRAETIGEDDELDDEGDDAGRTGWARSPATRSRARGCSRGGRRRRDQVSTQSCTSPSRTPRPTSTR